MAVTAWFVRPFILPGQHHFTRRGPQPASGPNRWNRQQGFYIYRRDRLIQSGGWCRLRTMDEHSKLARVAIDLPRAAEESFRINVAKMASGSPRPCDPSCGSSQRASSAGPRTPIDAPRVRCPIRSRTGWRRPTGGGTLGDHWPTIVDVLERELADHPDLLDRVLLGLINARLSPAGGKATLRAAERPAALA